MYVAILGNRLAALTLIQSRRYSLRFYKREIATSVLSQPRRHSRMYSTTYFKDGDATAGGENGEFVYEDDLDFRPSTALILTKLTRLEYERRTNPGLSDAELEKELRQRGSDYNRLMEHHKEHKEYLNVVCTELEKRKIRYQVVQRWEYNKEMIDWADVVFTAGGDGTFLLGASKIRDFNKPLIGINTDPFGSEGHMCLMNKLSSNHFPAALDRLLAGQFRWLWRQRIRVTMCGQNAFDDPIELHDQQLTCPEYRWCEHVKEQEDGRLRSGSMLKTPRTSVSISPTNDILAVDDKCRVLPYLALNEVFVGESLSSRVSYYELKIDDRERVKQKSSGITVCTGTGSTSWYFNINKLTENCVKELIEIMEEEVGNKLSVAVDDSKMISRICKKFNDKLIFSPSDLRMAFAVRDPVFNATFQLSPQRGFARRVEMKSRCFDAHLVIDGGMSFIFNHGAKAVLEIRPEDALRTVIFR